MKWTKNTWKLARGRDMKGGGSTCWAGKESWTSGGEWHQDSKTQINQNQNSLLQPMRFVNRGIYMIPSICSEICWFSRYYNNNNNTITITIIQPKSSFVSLGIFVCCLVYPNCNCFGLRLCPLKAKSAWSHVKFDLI